MKLEYKNMFIEANIIDVRKEINNWLDGRKPLMSNFFGLNEQYDYSYLEGTNSLILRKREYDFYRLFVMTTDVDELGQLLAELDDEVYVINIPSRKPIEDWETLLNKSGFKYYATYSRYCNIKIAQMKKHKTTLNLRPTQNDLDDIYNLLKESFSPYTGHLPSRNELSDMINNNQIFIDRYSDGQVCGVNIHTITGTTGFGNAWVDKGDHAVELLFDMYNEMIEMGVKRHIFWVNDANLGVAKMHIRMGAKTDGLKDYTYIKQSK